MGPSPPGWWCLFLKTCKTHFSLREESFTKHNCRRNPKEPRNKKDKLNKKERGSPHH
jgi:hypothetical protein